MNDSKSLKIDKRLHALTTLRFFAAFLIVFYHLNQHIDIVKTDLPFTHAITFFFILSGFILCYSYPSIETWKDAKKFYIARIARIWPAHFTYFVVTCILAVVGLIGTIGSKRAFLLNLTMLHSWIPVPNIYFSYNSPSWSISTEFFFYLCFPLIIYKWKETLKWKTLFIVPLPLIPMIIIAYFNIPDFTLPRSPHITSHGLLYIHPLARILEFFIGICGASLWLKYRSKFTENYHLSTTLEALVILLLMMNTLYYTKVIKLFTTFIPNSIEREFYMWAGGGVFSSLSIVLLLMIFANAKGFISQLLSHASLTFLGEISFSIYLSHYVLLNLYQHNVELFETFSQMSIISVYFACVVFISWIVWKYIEHPMRSYINGKFSEKKIVLSST